MGKSSIEWTESTWNPIVGCAKVSPGCAHCYAETMGRRLRAMALAKIEQGENPGRLRHYIDAIDDKGRWTGELVPVPEAIAQPYEWKRPRMVFVNSMSDLFHEDVPSEFISRVFATMYDCQWHTFQLLTKRPERAYQYLTDEQHIEDIALAAYAAFAEQNPEKAAIVTPDEMHADVRDNWPLPNLWLGTSIENQTAADTRIPKLIHAPAAVRFVSCEPLLDRVDFTALQYDQLTWINGLTGRNGVYHPLRGEGPAIDWLIIGCESSHNKRVGRLGEFATEAAWWDHARRIVDQCAEAGVPCFLKQGPCRGFVVTDPGEFPAGEWPRQFPRVQSGSLQPGGNLSCYKDFMTNLSQKQKKSRS